MNWWICIDIKCGCNGDVKGMEKGWFNLEVCVAGGGMGSEVKIKQVGCSVKKKCFDAICIHKLIRCIFTHAWGSNW